MAKIIPMAIPAGFLRAGEIVMKQKMKRSNMEDFLNDFVKVFGGKILEHPLQKKLLVNMVASYGFGCCIDSSMRNEAEEICQKELVMEEIKDEIKNKYSMDFGLDWFSMHDFLVERNETELLQKLLSYA